MSPWLQKLWIWRALHVPSRSSILFTYGQGCTILEGVSSNMSVCGGVCGNTGKLNPNEDQQTFSVQGQAGNISTSQSLRSPPQPCHPGARAHGQAVCGWPAWLCSDLAHPGCSLVTRLYHISYSLTLIIVSNSKLFIVYNWQRLLYLINTRKKTLFGKAKF